MNRIGIVNHVVLDAGTPANNTYAGKSGALTTTIAGLSEVDLLAEGGIAFFESSGALIDIVDEAHASPTSTDYIIMAIKTAGTVRTTHLEKGRVECTRTAYTAPVAKVINFGYTSTHTTSFPVAYNAILEGDEYIVKISKNDVPFYKDSENYFLIGVIVTKAIANAAIPMDALMQAIITKVNLTSSAHHVTMGALEHTGATTTLKVGCTATSTVAGEDFDIMGLEMLRGLATTVETANVKAVGTPALVKISEADATHEEGNNDQWGYTNGMGGFPSEVATSATYDILNIKYTRANTQVPNAKSFNDTMNFKLAVLVSADTNNDKSLAIGINYMLNLYK